MKSDPKDQPPTDIPDHCKVIKFESIMDMRGKATLFKTDKGLVWLPKSQYKVRGGYLILPDWLKLTYLEAAEYSKNKLF